jgi:hypothetical protein
MRSFVYVKSETNLLAPFHFSLKYIPMWHLWHMYVGGEINPNWVKAWKKGTTKCVDNPKKKTLNFWKITMEHCISKKLFDFQSSYIFKVTTTKNLWKFIMFQKCLYMFKALKKSRRTCGFFVSNFFFLMKYSLNHFNFFMNFNIFHRERIHVFKTF